MLPFVPFIRWLASFPFDNDDGLTLTGVVLCFLVIDPCTMRYMHCYAAATRVRSAWGSLRWMIWLLCLANL
jgi:hypothetical protein